MFHISTMTFTIVRIVTCLKWINWILSSCLADPSQPSNVLQRVFYSHVTYPLLSVLSTEHLWIDLITLNSIIYKSLMQLEKMTRYGSVHDSSSFFFYSFSLLFIVGGLSNLLAEYITQLPVDGMNGSLAAAIGYSLQAAPYTPLVRVYSSELHPGEILSYVFLMYLTQALFDSRRTAPSTMLTWLLGAFGGVALYEFQVQLYSR
jgi:hypothetical protein